MSLDNFQIPPSLIPELYKDSLVVLDAKQLKSESLNVKSPVFMGQFKKKILLMVEDANSLHLNDIDTVFLTGVLNACKLNFTDIALLNRFNNSTENHESLCEKLSPAFFIFFGVDRSSLSLPLEIENYQIKKEKNITYFAADSLDEIAQNGDKKKQLWNALKIIFSL